MNTQDRNIKKLLELMLRNQNCFSGGLCRWTTIMWKYKIISDLELNTLRLYIQENRPSKFSSIDAWNYRNHEYYWKSYNIKPRIKWIKRHIKKLSK
jgi:hypothetical protein